ncbi:MAG: hypothetical protein EOP51_30890, partial [Sphingobacteriales bacterium]
MRKFLLTAALALGVTAAVQAQNPPCTASFNINQTVFTPPYQVLVNNTSTVAPTGQYVYGYGSINYGDGSVAQWSTPGSTAVHHYTNPGSYTVSLKHYVV